MKGLLPYMQQLAGHQKKLITYFSPDARATIALLKVLLYCCLVCLTSRAIPAIMSPWSCPCTAKAQARLAKSRSGIDFS